MSDIALSSAVRGSLLSLQNTSEFIERTQGRLSTGLEVSSAIDDPVSFFQAKSLSDRAFDFNEKKDGIDQGVSTVTAALGGLESIEAIVRQLKGISSSLKSATGSQFTDLLVQYETLRVQIGELANDASYQGTNLISNTTETLVVSFSNETSSQLTITANDSAETGLGINDLSVATDTSFNVAARTNANLTDTDTITVTYQGSGVAANDTAALSVSYGTVSFDVFAANVNTSTDDGVALTTGQILTVTLYSAVGTGVGASGEFVAVNVNTGSTPVGIDIEGNSTRYVQEGVTSTITPITLELDASLTLLRARTQTLGSNVALLQTRLDFTKDYVNTLELGSGKLTLADLNKEGANLLALQTRQQLGIQSLAFAGKAEQGILGLFR